MPPRVAAIVLTYQGREVTLEALRSVTAMRYDNYDIVVVDNGSTDGTAEAVAAAFPQVAVVRVEDNRGAAGGYNLGMSWALARGYDYALILNNDIEVHPDLLGELVAVAARDPRIGAVGPKVLYFWNRDRIWSAGGRVRFREAVTRERGIGEVDRGQYDRDEPVDYINGCGLLIRREALLAAGLWDPIFHLSVEDADWCMRLRRCGFSVWYAHRAVLWHMVALTTGVYKPAKTFHTARSTAIFVRRYGNPWNWITYALYTLAALPAAFLRELPRRNTAAVLAKARGALAGLRAPLTPPPAATGEAATGSP
jgi:GT2 family glycosyltransferase